ncbi:MAG: phytoene/squalene synthase family protein [Acidimicrobiia bacterium]|nr:phytoene/squalene synthase family protein [Acidimicrobiia bacterium]
MNTDRVVLAASYGACRRLNRQHGTTYYWSTFLLPRWKRPHVHALYALCRYADDIVDVRRGRPGQRAAALAGYCTRFFDDLTIGSSDHPILAAAVDTAVRFEIDRSCFRRFFRSMAMDFTTSSYDTWEDLCEYMDGSAVVIGEMMLPILEPVSRGAARPARALGMAFQLTNFLRDVGEDLDRGRVYLPLEDLVRFGVDPERRIVDDSWRALMAFEIERARRLYARADLGAALLPPSSARCMRVARVLYSQILDRIEANDYDVFSTRARVSAPEKATLVLGTMGQRNPYGAAPVRWWIPWDSATQRRYHPRARKAGPQRS